MTNDANMHLGEPVEALTQILNRILKHDAQLTAGLSETKVLDIWPQAVGPAIAKHTRAYQIKDHTLFIEVDHPIWKQELHSNKQLALKKLNEAIQIQVPNFPTILDLFLVSPQPKRNQSKQKR
jgi:predicted nucleic acid-binding Zn ribbon protein